MKHPLHPHTIPDDPQFKEPIRESPLAVTFAIFVGGMIGGSLRFGLDSLATYLNIDTLPVGTFAANVSGSLLIGLFVGLFARHPNMPAATYSGVTVGLLGGYTTFSIFSMQVLIMLENGQLLSALAYAAFTLTLALIAVWLGEHWGRRTLAG